MGLYWYDTEFIESGYGKPFQLISIGIINEEGKEYYAVCKDFNPEDADDWVKENVLSKLDIPKEGPKKIDQIRKDIIKFVGSDPKPEFWAYYGSYDHVMLSLIFGRMIDLPENFPKFTMDLKQLAMSLDNPELPEQLEEGAHNALEDAKHNKKVYEFLINYKFTKKKFNLKDFKKLLSN